MAWMHNGIFSYSGMHLGSALAILTNPSAWMQLVQRMRMLDRGKAQIDWRLRGSVMAAQVDVDFQSDFTLDLITGRVTSMEYVPAPL